MAATGAPYLHAVDCRLSAGSTVGGGGLSVAEGCCRVSRWLLRRVAPDSGEGNVVMQLFTLKIVYKT